jgi:tetrahydromethanopterin:alpha-L-glutamate ligase
LGILKVGLITPLETPEIVLLAKRLVNKRVEVRRIDIDEFPRTARSIVHLNGRVEAWIDEEDLSDFASFYMSRGAYLSPLPISTEPSAGPRFPRPPWEEWLDLYRNYSNAAETEVESNAFKLSFLGILGYLRPVVNGLECAFLHYFKPLMMYKLIKAGVKVPPLVFGNEFEGLNEFVEKEKVVYKPLSGGREVRLMTSRYLKSNKKSLSYEPIMLQKFISGDGIRAYVVDGEVVCAVLIAQSKGYVDNRFDIADLTATELPVDVERMCVRASKAVGMRFCGVDLIRENNEYHIIDCNDRAGFAPVERVTGLPISERLADLLISLGK